MQKVFISGSMSIGRLDQSVINRLENIVNGQMQVIVGDANGIDSSIQKFFMGESFSSVVVYCSGSTPRNNIGQWPIKTIETRAKSGTREFYTAKDKAMASACNYGFMIWDTKSTGTLSNAIELLRQGKNFLVYINKERKFISIRTADDYRELISGMSEKYLEKAEKKLKIKNFLNSLEFQQSNLI